MAMAAATFLILLLAAPAAYATDYVVGDSNGWTNSGDYATWASGKTFTVGDNLLFSYGGSHSVDQVSRSNYDSCATGNALNSYTGGQNTIALTTAGPMYFICPSFGHCGQGMKLAINVVAASTTPGGGGTTPSPPSTTPATPTPPSTPTTTTTPNTVASPSGAAAAGGLGMLGFLLVLAPVIAFMG